MASELKSGLLGAAVDSESVCVAVHVRPLIDLETDQGCGECLQVTPGQPQVNNQCTRKIASFIVFIRHTSDVSWTTTELSPSPLVY